ncbi:MAG: hypothetical protein H7Y07_13365 [Pyrinomonadaceae bacterium]|nr:hypothetical protein [Sphingobacteriaceae bacterium]
MIQSFKKIFFIFTFIVSLSVLIPACKVQQSKVNYAAGRKLLLRDEGLSQLCYINLAKPDENWYMPVPAGRDIQLVGAGRVLIGTATGYEEREIKNGKKVAELTSFAGTQTARRLRNGNTLLAGANWQDKTGIVLTEVKATGKVVGLVAFPGFSYVRCIRQTVSGNYLVTADDIVFEGDASGKIVWQAKATGLAKPHIWQSLRLANGQTVVSGGYAKNLQIFDADGKQVKVITGPADVNPNFFAGFQILKNGNYVVGNWQGHGPKFGASGTQILEYDVNGKLVWSWKQDPTKFSSLQGVIVLDGLDTDMLHVEDKRGVLMPVIK